MSKMSASTLKTLLASEKADALAGMSASKLQEERSRALDYYNGDMSRDMPTEAGRSSAVSTDVLDTVEGLMPPLLDIFCGGDEVVKFDPVGPEDVKAAEQESDYVNHVFMQQNQGFLVLYTFIKDALLSKVGVVKIWTEEYEEEKKETYLDQPEEALMMLAANPDIEIIEHTARPDGLHDITIKTKKTKTDHCVENVPPEEFGISRKARSIQDCGYCYHEVAKTEAEAIECGYDPDQIKGLPSYNQKTQNTETLSRDTVEDSIIAGGEDGVNTANRIVKITEHYVVMDYEGDNKAKLYRVTTGGEQGEILTRDGKDDIEEVEFVPFAAMSPIIMPHRFFGKSIADLVMDIQRIKTALTRATLDSTYLSIRPRIEVAESHVGPNTLDDLLVSRAGGVVRTKQPGGLSPIMIPPIGGITLPLIEYFDATREWRTGVTRQGQGIDANALQNQSATAVNQQFTAAQARMKLIARIFAETGIRDMFSLLHATIRKSGSQAATVRLRNQWVQVDPRDWKERNDMTISVGLGDGSRAEKLAETQILIQAQKDGIGAGLVSPKNLYNTSKRLTRLLGEKDPDMYFTPPDRPPDPQDPSSAPIPPPSDPMIAIKQQELQAKQQEAQADLQVKQADMQMRGQEMQAKAAMDMQADQRKAQIESVQAQADIATQDRKMQAEMAMAQQKFEMERELKMLDFQLKREMQAAELEMKREAHQQQLQAGYFKVAAGAQAHEMKMESAENAKGTA